jgi:hypothetical protein
MALPSAARSSSPPVLVPSFLFDKQIESRIKNRNPSTLAVGGFFEERIGGLSHCTSASVI